MKLFVSSLAAILVPGLLSPPASAQPLPSERTESEAQRDQRQRGAPRVKPYTGPSKYRQGSRPRNLDRYRREAVPNTYRHNYRAQKRYRAAPYVRPQGWYFNRWIYGDILPALFWSRSYWLTDFWLFGLPVPPRGYVWVRYGDDALLVQISSGVILQVIYQVFY